MDFTNNIDLVHRYLDTLSLRQNVVSDNIANVDTPGFKRSKISFESELKKAFQREGLETLGLQTTNEKHFGAIKNPGYLEVKPHRMLDYTTSVNNNGNNVNIESEMSDLYQTQMMYDLMSNVEANYFRQISLVVK